MSRYEKISSGSGIHGVKYEINLLSYYLLKAYESKESFRLSNGQKDTLKLDDIILETDSCRIFAQAKHIDNGSKKITTNQLFQVTGKYSLHVYLKVAWVIFRQFLQDIQGRLQELLSLQGDNQEIEQLFNSVGLLIDLTVDGIDTFCEGNFHIFILNLRKLNCDRINLLIRSFHNTTFHLVTNISPNDELQVLSVISSNLHYNFTEQYNFNTINIFDKLVEKTDIPKWFVKSFLEKFHLVIISNDTLHKCIKNSLKLLSANVEIPHEVTYDDINALIEDWQAKQNGIYLTRGEVDVFFAYTISKNFVKEIATYEGLIEFNIDDLKKNINSFLVTLVETPRYLIIMANLQKILLKNDLSRVLFVNPRSDLPKQKLVIKSFLHQKYTHLVCVVQQQNAKELIPLLHDLILNIEKHEKFKNYKKIILLCSEGVEIFNNGNRVLMQDKSLFENCKLYMRREPDSLGDIESYYIPRELNMEKRKFKKLTRTEDDFVNRKIDHRSFAIISDSAGKGKTSLLKSCVVKINKGNQQWSIMIQLNLFTDLLERHSILKTVPNLDDFLDILVTDTFKRQVCQIPNILIVMVDGFDEISPDYSDIAIEFLKKAKREENVKTVIVTTRRHLGKLLKKTFSRASYSLKPLSSEDICSLISTFRKQDLNDTKKWYDSLPSNICDFFVNPLHVKMFSASFQLNEQLPNDFANFNLYKLYEDFINEKKDIFINEKCLCQGNIYVKKMLNENFKYLLEMYEKFALEMTFKKEVLEELGVAENGNESPFDEDLCTIGILEYSEARLRFVHETFREFFVAKWLIAQINSLDENKIKTIMEKVFMKSYEIKRFIESYLAGNWDKLNEDILDKIGNITFKYGELFFDMLYINYDFVFLTKLMLEKCHNTMLFNKLLEDFINVFSNDRQLVQLDFVFYLIRKGANANLKNERGKNLLHIAVDKNNIETVKHLCQTDCFNINEEDLKGGTPLILALINNNIEMAEFLIDHGADINQLKNQIDIRYNRKSRFVEIEYKFNAYRRLRLLRQDIICVKVNSLHIAAYNGNLNTIRYILAKNVCEIDELASYDFNVLHCAAQSGNLEAVRYFCGLNVRFDQVSDIGQTVLHFAVCSGNIDLVEYFVTLGVKIDAVTNSKYTDLVKCKLTALGLAVYHKQYKIIEYLLQNYLRMEIADDNPAVHEALRLLCRNKDYNEIFKTVYEKYKCNFPESALADFLEHVVYYSNTDLVHFLSVRNIYESHISISSV